jgi:hypothetical protein
MDSSYRSCCYSSSPRSRRQAFLIKHMASDWAALKHLLTCDDESLSLTFHLIFERMQTDASSVRVRGIIIAPLYTENPCRSWCYYSSPQYCHRSRSGARTPWTSARRSRPTSRAASPARCAPL